MKKLGNKFRILNNKTRVTQQKRPKRSGYIFVISGPSGSGKTTLARNLLEDGTLKNKLKKSISFTTRPKRSNEHKNKDYFFISEQQFKKNLRAKKILEWTKYLGYYYGTPKEFIDAQLKSGKNVLLCVDLKGVVRLKRFYPDNTVSIFIKGPSFKELQIRIENRSRDISREEVCKRIKLAKKEVLAARKFDYCLENKNLDKTTNRLKDIILSELGHNQGRR